MPSALGLEFAFVFLFFFNDTATTEIYTLSLHDALPIFSSQMAAQNEAGVEDVVDGRFQRDTNSELRVAHAANLAVPCLTKDRKSTRLNSSHANISYAVFCLKKKKKIHEPSAPKSVHDKK